MLYQKNVLLFYRKIFIGRIKRHEKHNEENINIRASTFVQNYFLWCIYGHAIDG